MRVRVTGLKYFSRGRLCSIAAREWVRWVLKASVEGLGRGGWISRVGGEEVVVVVGRGLCVLGM